MTSSREKFDEIVSVAVYPGIGLARVGNSPEYFIGPEAPDVIADPGGGDDGPGPDEGWYKDRRGRLKPQAARFRLFGLDAAGKAVPELTANNTTSLEWTVHVRNMKAANYAFRGRYFFDPTLKRNPNIQGDDIRRAAGVESATHLRRPLEKSLLASPNLADKLEFV